jgi:hypothetical protein
MMTRTTTPGLPSGASATQRAEPTGQTKPLALQRERQRRFKGGLLRPPGRTRSPPRWMCRASPPPWKSASTSGRCGRCGRDRIRTCVGNAGDFTGRIGVTSRVPFRPHLVPIIAPDVRKRATDSFSHHSASPPISPRPAWPSVGRREVGGKSRLRSDQEVPSLLPPRVRLQRLGCRVEGGGCRVGPDVCSSTPGRSPW